MNDVIALTKELVNMQSVTALSNVPITDFIQGQLHGADFEIERLEYEDKNGVRKANLIAKLGEGEGGLAFCSHSDTVPGQEQDWPAFSATVKDGRLYGRGSCDMKGPLAATMVAMSNIEASKLTQPLYLVVTADEEIGLGGAKYVSKNSDLLKRSRPAYGVIAEPTRMIPVYAHKGFVKVRVVSHGEAAHTSTGRGTSATLRVAPFMADMAALAERSLRDKRYMNDEFSPPTNGFNMIVNDGNCALNVTASRTEVTIALRAMPNSRAEELMIEIVATAEKYGLEAHSEFLEALYVPLASNLITSAQAATKIDTPETVPYGTDGSYLQDCINELVILGPGDIAVAHTVGESIPVDELERAVGVYEQMIEQLCMNNGG